MSHPDGAPPARSVPYATFAREVLELYDFRAKKTIAKLRQVLREFGELGIKETSELRPVLVARWRKAHPDRGASTVHSLLRSFRAACEIGIASGYLATSPVALKLVWPEVEAPDPDEEKHHAIADIRAVLLHLRAQVGFGWHPHRLYALASTVAYTGVRKMEALRLTVPDVDFGRRCLRIVARQRLKTRASEAPVGMPDELAEILAPWAAKTGAIWLFPNATRTGPWTGGPPGHKPLDRLKAEAEKAGVPGFTFLSLRHSWATHGEYWGLGETMIQRQLRHTNLRTQKVYRHADAANLARSVHAITFRDEPTPPVAPTLASHG